METIIIEEARKEELDRIRKVYASAKAFMVRSGNPHQWEEGYPSSELLLSDLEKHQLFVLKASENIIACFVFFVGLEKTYAEIFQGRWIGDESYGVIHRVASDQSHKGILPLILSYCASKKAHLRMDTYQDNKVMQHLLVKNGFARCGIIHLENGSERIAYERLS